MTTDENLAAYTRALCEQITAKCSPELVILTSSQRDDWQFVIESRLRTTYDDTGSMRFFNDDILPYLPHGGRKWGLYITTSRPRCYSAGSRDIVVTIESYLTMQSAVDDPPTRRTKVPYLDAPVDESITSELVAAAIERSVREQFAYSDTDVMFDHAVGELSAAETRTPLPGTVWLVVPMTSWRDAHATIKRFVSRTFKSVVNDNFDYRVYVKNVPYSPDDGFEPTLRFRIAYTMWATGAPELSTTTHCVELLDKHLTTLLTGSNAGIRTETTPSREVSTCFADSIRNARTYTFDQIQDLADRLRNTLAYVLVRDAADTQYRFTVVATDYDSVNVQVWCFEKAVKE